MAVNSWMNQPQGYTLTDGDVTDVDPLKVVFNPAVNLGAGLNFFISSSIALKLDARTLIYVGEEADYIVGDIDPSTGQQQILDDEIQTVFITTGGISIFVPKMKPRLFNF